MEWQLYNWSLNCPKALEMPDCGFRGRPVQVNSDICCPEWECPCKFAFLTGQAIFQSGGDCYFFLTDHLIHHAKVIAELSPLNL